MTRPLRASDRLPQKGDILTCGAYRVTVRDVAYPLGFALVYDGRGLTRIGLRNLCGYTAMITADGKSSYGEWRGVLPARKRVILVGLPGYRYLSRADGGRIDWPIDCGAYC